MRIRIGSRREGGWEGEAVIRSKHEVSTYGSPLMFVNGEPVGPMEALDDEYELVEASDEERELLLQGGYIF